MQCCKFYAIADSAYKLQARRAGGGVYSAARPSHEHFKTKGGRGARQTFDKTASVILILVLYYNLVSSSDVKFSLVITLNRTSISSTEGNDTIRF